MKSWIIIANCFAVFIALSNAVSMEIPEHLKKQAKKLHKHCQSQTDTPDDVIKECLKGVLPKNKNLECYIQCLFETMGIMDESNSIHIDYLLQILPEELHPTITMLSEACGTKDGSDKCNVAYNTMQCYVENNPFIIKNNLEFLFD